MTQVLRIELDSIDITDYFVKARISQAINRFYNVASIEVTDDVVIATILGKVIDIYYGDSVFTGFVFSTQRVSKNSHTLTVRSYGAKLTEPFSPYQITVDGATTASGLCSEYSTAIGLPIAYNTVDLDFGGNYERSGTMLNALTSIANTTGAEYYDKGDSVVIEANKSIQETHDHELKNDEYFDFVSDGASIYNAGVGTVRTSTGNISSEDIVENNKINLDVFDDATAHIYCIPNGTIETQKGFTSISELKQKIKVENATIVEETVIYLDASIADIVSVKLNGFEITDFNFEVDHSAVYFLTPQSGFIEIEYSANYQLGIPSYTSTPNGDLAIVTLYYLNQVLNHFWYINSSTVFGGSTARVYVDSDSCIYRGFNVHMLDDGVPSINLYANGVLFHQVKEFESSSYISKTFVPLSPLGNDQYEHRIDATATIEYLTTFGREMVLGTDYTVATIGEEKVLSFTEYYPKLELTISEASNKVVIPATRIDGEILMTVEDLNTDEVDEFEICNIDWNDINSIPCELDQFAPIDVADLLDMELNEVSGVVLQVTRPDGIVVPMTVEADGIGRLWVDMNGDYIMDVSSLTGRSIGEIKLEVTV